MTKDVLLSISGLHTETLIEGGKKEDDEAIEVVSPAQYFWKNGKHYILYEEVEESSKGITKNKIKIIGNDKIEINKRGISNATMIFEKNKKNSTYYETPYGQLLLDVYTNYMEVEEKEENINVKIKYQLEVNHEPLADCMIRINIVPKDAADFIITNHMDF